MKAKRYYSASRRHAFVAVLGIAFRAFLVLISIASATQSVNSTNSGGNYLEKGIKTQEEALQRNPQDENAWVHKGDDFADLKRYDEAIIAYDQAIQINPRDSDAWEAKGDILVKLGRSDEAIRAYNKAIEINPQDSEVRNKKNTLLKQIK
jgi:superkiller protein 3